MSRHELGHLPMAFFLEGVRAEEEEYPLRCTYSLCLIWKGGCPSWEMPGPWEVVWMKGLMDILEVTEAYKIYPLVFPHARKTLRTWAWYEPPSPCPHCPLRWLPGASLSWIQQGKKLLQYLQNPDFRMGAVGKMSCRP